jgi:uncharacterized membrane protein
MTARKNRDAGSGPAGRSLRPFRTTVLRGLGVLLPPLLTIVIFLWIWGTIELYVFEPAKALVRNAILWGIEEEDIRKPLQHEELPKAEQAKENPTVDGVVYRLSKQDDETPTYVPNKGYRRLKSGEFVPNGVYKEVEGKLKEGEPGTGDAVYRRYVELKYLPSYLVIPFFLSVFILVLYLLGKFIAAGAGRFFVGLFERGITRVPLVRNVYSSVKQVSDFLLSERQVQYSRVVAVEWPRKGIWTLSLVTGPSFPDIRAIANEEVLSVLVPTSPMPMTGFTVTVKKSETVDLDISIDEAIQFIVSCGVVVPPEEIERMRAIDGTSSELVATRDSAPSDDS